MVDRNVWLRRGIMTVLGLLSLVYLYPLYWIVMNLFKSNVEIRRDFSAFPQGDFIQQAMTNLSQAWTEANFLTAFTNTFLITVLSVLGIVVVSSMAAYALVRAKHKISWVLFLAPARGLDPDRPRPGGHQ